MRKKKSLNLGPNVPYLGIFCQNFKKLLSYLKSAPSKLVKNESLTHAVNFDIRSAFSKGSGSAFSEGSGPDPGLLYKVCHGEGVKEIDHFCGKCDEKQQQKTVTERKKLKRYR